MRKLWSGRKVRYENVFDDAGDRSELVATFLAILELVKGKRVRISEDNGEVSLHLLKDESSVSADRGAENE